MGVGTWMRSAANYNANREVSRLGRRGPQRHGGEV
jgi:hypothetical protein